jgi:hypothetical protein
MCAWALCAHVPAVICACADKIVTGSLSGLLRIFMPRQQDYQVEDLKLEEDLGAPILQLTIGRFLPYGSSSPPIPEPHVYIPPPSLSLCAQSTAAYHSAQAPH